jgi:mono/diheme cytochrome c family protein
MSTRNLAILFVLTCAGIGFFAVPGRTASEPKEVSAPASTVAESAAQKFIEGRRIFRFDTFGDQQFWGDALKLHQAIEGSKFGGVGPGVSPSTALAVGLKVDVDVLPASLIQQLKNGKVDLNDPGVTLALLKLNSVVGVTGFFKPDGTLKSVGIQCALCHSTVDNSLAPGIGHRLDGWANRDLNVGQIIALSPNLEPFADLLGVDQATVRAVLQSWGPGHFDAELALDGKAFRPDGKTSAVLIPPAFGLAGVNLHTWTGWGSVPYWNAFVANLEMHGKGNFFDPRLDNADQFPVAAKAGFGHVTNSTDLITPKLAALHFYQLALPAPNPPAHTFDPQSAQRGQKIFNGSAKCATCHVPPLYTDPGWNLHTPSEVCVDSFQADRAPDHRYRTSPLGGLWTHTKGGFYHDGRFSTLLDVVNHYDSCLNLGLADQDKADLVEFLKSIPGPTAK